MRIEAQGKYLHAILQKAQEKLNIDISTANLEITKKQLVNLNIALSDLKESINQMGEFKAIVLEKKI